jgi:hypothetical protein
MANRILLQTLLRFSDQIKSGAAKVQDVVTDYFNQTGKSVTDEERGIILKEFQDNAPSNVTTLEGVDPRETILPTDPNINAFGADKRNFDMDTFRSGLEQTYRETVANTLKKLQEASPAEKSKMIKEIINRQGLYRSFDQVDISKLLKSVDDSQLQDFVKVQAQKPTTLRPKRYLGYTEDGRPIESPVYFDDMGANEKSIDFSRYKNKKDRDEYAEFVRKMRKEGIRNKDIQNIARTTGDIAEGKRAATTLARANDMAADTKIKQEFLSDLDEMKADRGPRYFQGDDVGGPMGYDSYGEFLDSKGAEIINAIEEDLITKGVPEEKAEELLQYVRDLRRESTSPLKNDLKGLVDKIGEDLGDALDNEEIKIFYSTRFWKKYVDEILRLSQKPEPRFAHGGLV